MTQKNGSGGPKKKTKVTKLPVEKNPEQEPKENPEPRVRKKPPAKTKAELSKAKALTMLLSGASERTMRVKLGVDADIAIAAVLNDIRVSDIETTTKINMERLSNLMTGLMPKAEKGNEVAINAVIKIMQVQQQLILAYQASAPKEPTPLDKFREPKGSGGKKNMRK